MVPEGWKERTLESLSSQKVTYGVVKPGDVRTGGVPFVRGGDFPNGTIRVAELRTISREISNTYKRTLLKGGEILVSLVGYPGATAIVPTELAGANIARQAALVRPSAKIDRDYLFQFLRSDIGQKRMLSQSIGSAQQVINLKDLNALSIACPPLPEQRKIADILSTWDTAIEMTEALLVTVKAQKRALMQSLLKRKRRFPEFGGQPWKEVRLVDVLKGKKVKGKIVPTNYEQVGVPYIGATSFQGDFSVHTDASGAVICEPQDLLVLWDGENAGAVAVGLRGAVSSTVVRFRFDFRIVSASFVCAMMEMNNYQIRAVREGSGIPHMPKDFDHWFVFRLPPINEQEKIMSAIDAAQMEVRLLILQIEKLRTEKKALMQQLLTGKRRVSV